MSGDDLLILVLQVAFASSMTTAYLCGYGEQDAIQLVGTIMVDLVVALLVLIACRRAEITRTVRRVSD